MKNYRRWLLPPAPAKGKFWSWLLRRLLTLLLLFSVILLGVGLIFKDRLIFHPVEGAQFSPRDYRLEYEERWLTTAGGDSVRAWRIFRPADSPSQITVLFFQGNSGNMSLMLDRLAALQNLGFECFSVDYPGYGPSPGRPSEENTYQSAEALQQWAVESGAALEATIVYGFSLGGGVASYLAAEKNLWPGGGRGPAALVLDSTFTRLRDVPGRQLPFLKPYLYVILGDAFNTKGRLSQALDCPLLVLHSPDDDVVPFSLGLENFQLYPHQKDMAAGIGDHMGFLLNKNLYLGQINNLAEALERPEAAPDSDN